MIVLLHPQGFTDTAREKTQIQPRLCHSQAVSQLMKSIDLLQLQREDFR